MTVLFILFLVVAISKHRELEPNEQLSWFHSLREKHESGISLASDQHNLVQQSLSKLTRELDDAIKRGQVAVTASTEAVRVTLNDEAFFASGSSEVQNQSALKNITKIAEILVTLPNNIRIEGHTDAVPVNGKFADNWLLSCARAHEILAIFEQRGIKSGRLSIAGYGETLPRDTNVTSSGRSHNRRVEISVLFPIGK